MAGKSLDENVKAAVDLLPPVGTELEFNAYKSKLYAADPDGGKDAFTYLLKNDLLKKKLSRDATGKIVVMLSRQA